MSIRTVVGAVAVLLLGGMPTRASASGGATFRFTTVLDSQRDGLEATRCPAINSFGTVAVQVHDNALGFNKLVTKRGARDAPVVIADTRSITDFPTLCDNGFTLITSNPSINEKGEVAFQGNLRRAARAECSRERRQGIFLGAGGRLTPIAHTINPPGGDFISEFLVADTSVNTSGRVALVAELDGTFDQGLFLGSRRGTFETRQLASTGPFNGISSPVSLNEVGQIAFEASLKDSFTSGIFLSNPGGTFTTLVDNTGELDFVLEPSLNIFGRVAFQGFRDDNSQGIFTSRGGRVTTVADSRGPYSSFQEPSLNDLGQVVFTANLDELSPEGREIQGVFTGPNPATDTVLRSGGLYEGVLISSVFTCRESLNNRGQVVMIVQSEDPVTFEVRTFVVKATPVFERDDDD